ncbi:type II secretion system protein [Shewanella nanhaiensis]|uniref:type II secretion system protein n=1 Tax=Shewanella nanhaiensis TaxID=2864872 RepID=UPI0022B95F20|nr:prepilin-type N-terminal cleavage/methylation domain-containing protein [Shewanella nanhaiensis]
MQKASVIRHYNQGFTLIELVVVIIILGILAVTAAPKFINLSSDAQASTLKGMAGAMKSYVSMSVSEGYIKGREINVVGSNANTYQIDDVGLITGVPRGDDDTLTGEGTDGNLLPEIYEAIELDVAAADMVHARRAINGWWAPVLTYKSKVSVSVPTATQIIATNCYVDYQPNPGKADVLAVTSGC